MNNSPVTHNQSLLKLSNKKSLALLGNVDLSVLNKVDDSAIIYAKQFIADKHNSELILGRPAYPFKDNGKIKFRPDKCHSDHPGNTADLHSDRKSQLKKPSIPNDTNIVSRLYQFQFPNTIFTIIDKENYLNGEKANLYAMEFTYRGCLMELIISKSAAHKNFSRVTNLPSQS